MSTSLFKAPLVRGVWRKWQELSYTHQRECVEAVEGAKRPETRERRIQRAVEQVGAKALRK